MVMRSEPALKGPQQFAIVFASLILSIGVMAVMIAWMGTSPPDAALLAACAVPCVLALGWVAIGAPQPPQPWLVPIMMPAMMAGMALLLGVSDKYAMLWPVLTGAALAIVFAVVGCCATALALHLRSEGQTLARGEMAARLVVAALVFLFGGVLFFQPLVLLVNARGEVRPPLVLRGVIANLYETHGKHTSYFVQFSGPAAAYSTTFTRGEFEIDGKAFDTMHVGDRDCVTIHTGLLRLQWWAINDCGRGDQVGAIMQMFQQGHHATALTQLEALFKADPHVLDALPPEWIANARRALAVDNEPDMARRLLAMLASPAYVPSDPDKSADSYRYDYALTQVWAKDRAGATATLARIDNPIMAMQATLDMRLDGLTPTGFDARAAVDRAMARQRAVIAQHPDALGPILRLSGLYLNLDDGQAMVDLLKGAKPGVDHPHMQATDPQRQAWWWYLAQGYLLLGRYDDGLRTMRASMASGQVNHGNPMVPIQIANAQLTFGHARDALTTLARLDKRPEGWTDRQEAFLRQNSACARYLSGQGDAGQADLDWLHDHAREAGPQLLGALLCMHADDEAAAVLIRDMRNPAFSATVRLELSRFAPFPASYPGNDAQRGLARMIQRSDVRATIAQTGGTGMFDIPPL